MLFPGPCLTRLQAQRCKKGPGLVRSLIDVQLRNKAWHMYNLKDDCKVILRLSRLISITLGVNCLVEIIKIKDR